MGSVLRSGASGFNPSVGAITLIAFFQFFRVIIPLLIPLLNLALVSAAIYVSFSSAELRLPPVAIIGKGEARPAQGRDCD